MLSNSIYFLNLVHPEKSWCRDKVNGVASRPAYRQAGDQVVMPAQPNNLSIRQIWDRSFGRGFCTSPWKLYRDMTNHAHLSRPRHLDSFIVTTNSHPSIGTLPAFIKTTAFKAKTPACPQAGMPTLTPLATARGRLTATNQTAGPLGTIRSILEA